MKIRFLIYLLSFITLCQSTYAGFYVKGGLLYNSPDDIEVKGANNYTSVLDNSLGFTGAVGYKLSYLRIEGELNFFDSKISGNDLEGINTAGNLEKTSIFANAYFEIPGTPIIEPYIGAGIGITQVDFDFQTNAEAPAVPELAFSSSYDDSILSFQLMAGLRFNLIDSVEIYAGYRYISTQSLSFTDTNYSLNPGDGQNVFEVGFGFGF